MGALDVFPDAGTEDVPAAKGAVAPNAVDPKDAPKPPVGPFVSRLEDAPNVKPVEAGAEAGNVLAV